jgi:hypothetical protein
MLEKNARLPESNVVDPDSMGALDPYPDLDSQPDPGVQKIPTKIEKVDQFSFFVVLGVLF